MVRIGCRATARQGHIFPHENEFRVFFHSAIAYPTRSPLQIVKLWILVGS